MAKTAKATEEKIQENQQPQEDALQADSKKQVQAVEFPEAVETVTRGPSLVTRDPNDERRATSDELGRGNNLDIILDMNVPVTVAIGQTAIPVRRLLQLGPGSVLKLGKPIDEPADLYLKEVKFAAGDIVVVDGRFAVRIKQIIGGVGGVQEQKGTRA
jgi:flagellar motor switch protein FliN/FliY